MIGDGSITVLISVPSDTKKSSIFSNLTPKEWKFGVNQGELIIDGMFYSKIAPDECFWTFDGPGVIQMTLQKIDPEEGLWPVSIIYILIIVGVVVNYLFWFIFF